MPSEFDAPAPIPASGGGTPGVTVAPVTTSAGEPRRPRRRHRGMTTTSTANRGHLAAGITTALLHLGIGVFPLSASGLLAPLWAIVVIYLGWAAMGVVAHRTWRSRGWLALLVPPATLALWAAFITFGDVALGWTA